MANQISFEGKGSKGEVMAHIANMDAIPSSKHIFHQLEILISRNMLGFDTTHPLLSKFCFYFYYFIQYLLATTCLHKIEL